MTRLIATDQRAVGAPRPRVCWVTDFAYPAKGRNYGAEDRWLIDAVSDRYEVATLHPSHLGDVQDADVVVIRNCGPMAEHEAAFAEFRSWAPARVHVYNELSGRADMLGKQYLLDMFAAGMPVIPTVVPGHFEQLPAAMGYVAKPIDGADSNGLRFVDSDTARSIAERDLLIQPRIDIDVEISYVFVDHEYQYAVSTTSGGERWELVEHVASAVEQSFAGQFIAWNSIRHGIQRVDACRTHDGSLLLVELEDLNPFLSLDRISSGSRHSFVVAFMQSLDELLQTRLA